MLDRVVAVLSDWLRRLRALERREVGEFRRWVENTENLLHLSIVVFVPLLLGLVTWLSNAVELLPFLLFPPLASGTYTLFAQPESEYASPRRFVGGLTIGALCGYLAFEAAVVAYGTSASAVSVHPEAVALGVFLTAVVTWALDLEEASAFSSALLVQVIQVNNPATYAFQLLPGVTVSLPPRAAYVGSVFLSTTVVAAVFLLWREAFYEERAAFLYGTTRGDDHVLVPMRGEDAPRTALFGARLAAAHEAGKVVLLEVFEDLDLGGVDGVDGIDGDGVGEVLEGRHGIDPEDLPDEVADAVEAAAADLTAHADRIRTRVGVPCEVVIATGRPGPTAIETARRTNCDLVVTPYEEAHGSLSRFVRTIFGGPIDAVAFRSVAETTRWKRVLVAVARPGDSAHAMIDFALRLADRSGVVSAFTCISSEVERRTAERRLADVVEAFDGPIETRVAREEVTDFIEENAGSYDLVVLGSSGDRSTASRFVSPPTFERLRDVDCDVAVVDRGWVE